MGAAGARVEIGTFVGRFNPWPIREIPPGAGIVRAGSRDGVPVGPAVAGVGPVVFVGEDVRFSRSSSIERSLSGIAPMCL